MRLYKKRATNGRPYDAADVVTYGVIGAKGVPYEVNGKSRCAVKCGVWRRKRGVEGTVPYENITQKEATNGRPHTEKLFFAFFDSVFM